MTQTGNNISHLKDKHLVTIFDKLEIRDGETHYPDEFNWLDGRAARQLAFSIDNQLDVSVTIQPIGRLGAVEGKVGSPISVSSKSMTFITLKREEWLPLVSCTVTASSVPSNGYVSVYGYWQPVLVMER